jgi:hypothetical protein
MLLSALARTCLAEQAAAGAQQLVVAMSTTNDTDAISSLGSALGYLGEYLAAEQVAGVVEHLVTTIDRTTDPWTLSSLCTALAESVPYEFGRELGSLANRLPANRGAELAQQIVAVMERTTEPQELSHLGDALGTMTESLEVRDTISVLKSMPCVGELRTRILSGLEMKTGQAFYDNAWNALAWAERQGIDVENVPLYPLANQK